MLHIRLEEVLTITRNNWHESTFMRCSLLRASAACTEPRIGDTTGMSTIIRAATAADLAACYPVMHQLRPHLSEAGFIEQVQRQELGGYRLTLLECNAKVLALVGWRILESLSFGKHCFVDDLVTDASARSTGCGSALFDWLVTISREAGCTQLHLESGVQRFGAHRFYLARRMDITCHHFALNL